MCITSLTGNCEEDDHDSDEGGSDCPAGKVLHGLDAQIAPNNLLRHDTKLACLELLVGPGLAALHHLPGILRMPLGVKLEEDGSDQVALAVPVFVLLLGDLGHELSEVRSSVLDSVNLLADQELELVCRSFLGVNPLGAIRYIAGDEVLLALLCLDPVHVGFTQELVLAILQLHSSLVTVLNQVVQLLRV